MVELFKLRRKALFVMEILMLITFLAVVWIKSTNDNPSFFKDMLLLFIVLISTITLINTKADIATYEAYKLLNVYGKYPVGDRVYSIFLNDDKTEAIVRKFIVIGHRIDNRELVYRKLEDKDIKVLIIPEDSYNMDYYACIENKLIFHDKKQAEKVCEKVNENMSSSNGPIKDVVKRSSFR